MAFRLVRTLPPMYPRGILRTFIVLLVLSLLKYVYLAGFAHPGADDLCYAAKSRGVSLLDWSIGEYHAWNGRYASNVLMARGPLSWSADFLSGYRAAAVVLLLLTWAAAWVFLRACTRNAWKAGTQAVAALVFTALFLHAMPDLAEGIYWYTGAVTYQLANILLLVHLAGLIELGRMERKRPALVAGLALLAVVIAGMDEVHMLLLIGVHALALGRAFLRTRRIDRSLLLLLVVVLACGAVVALAPGNAVRGSFLAGTHQFGRSLGMSVVQTGRFLTIWTLSPALLALSVLYIPVHARLREHVPFLRRGTAPWKISALIVALVLACVFPAYWGTGVLGQYRTLNVACFFFLWLWWWQLSAWLEHPWGRRFHDLRSAPVWVVAFLFMAAVDLDLSRNGRRAWDDIVEGRAKHYDEALSAREAALRQGAATGTTVILSPLEDPPKTLFTLEERDAESRWMSTCTARYFGVDDDRVRMAPAR